MSNESINNCVRNIVSQANELTKKELNARSASKVEPTVKTKVEPTVEAKVEPAAELKYAPSKMEQSNKTAEPAKSDKTSTIKSDQHESITIIQTKPVSNSRTAIKFDSNNNNLPPQDASLKEHSTAGDRAPQSTDEIDKQTPVKNKQLNGDDLAAVKVKQEALPEIELIIRVSLEFSQIT